MVGALDQHDIQGNILKAYGRHEFPKARFVLLAFDAAAAGRAFVTALTPSITTAASFAAMRERTLRASHSRVRTMAASAHEITTNVAFTFAGLRALELPSATLQSFPEEFASGMRARATLLGDTGKSAPEHWDPVWREDEPPHLLVTLAARDESSLARRYAQLGTLLERSEGVRLLSGHRGAQGAEDLPFQSASAIYRAGAPTRKEHFGYIDAISQTYFEGSQLDERSAVGGGKRGDYLAGASALATGELLLGYPNESQAFAEAPVPKHFAWNSTFMVLRKLHQNVGSFDSYLEHIGREFPGGKEALAAKLAGRWRNGAPLSRFPEQREAEVFAEQWTRARHAIDHANSISERARAKQRFAELHQQYNAFDYNDDASGARCPLGAHIRRAHPRSVGSDKHRLLRRSLPYGDSQASRTDYGEHGLIFIAYNASLRRQFELVQREWLHSGDHVQLGDETDPLLGDHPSFVVQTAPDDPRPPFFCNRLPQFVETRGGDYFFVPGMNALRMIAAG